MRTDKSPLVLSFVLLLALPAAPDQTQGGAGAPGSPPSGTLTEYQLRIGQPLAGERYTRTIHGDYDGDAQLDVAYLLGNRVEILLAPGLYEALITDVIAASAIATLRGETHDTLLAVNNTGLHSVSWDSSAGAEESPWDQVLLDDTDWPSAKGIDVWTRGGADYLVGLSADGSRILGGMRTSTGWSFLEALDTGLSPGFEQVIAFDYDGDAVPEVGVTLGDELFVYDLWSEVDTPIECFEEPYFNFAYLARVRQAVDPAGATPPALPLPGVAPPQRAKEWVAAVRDCDFPGYPQYFAVYGDTGRLNDTAIGYDGIVGMSVGDVDADGNEDLIVSQSANWNLTWIMNVGAPGADPSFGAVTHVRLAGPTGSAPTNRAQPLIADLDGDGDGDVVFPRQDSATLWVRREGIFDHVEKQPRVEIENIGGELLGAWVSNTQELIFDIEMPQTVPSRYLDIVAYQQSAVGYFDPIPIAGSMVRLDLGPTLPAAGSTIAHILQVPGGRSLNEGAGPASFDCRIWLVMQFVEAANATATTPPSFAYPGSVTLLQAQGDITTTNGEFVSEAVAEHSFDVEALEPFAAQSPEDDDDVGFGGMAPCIGAEENKPPKHY